jgi:hypothetical protein
MAKPFELTALDVLSTLQGVFRTEFRRRQTDVVMAVAVAILAYDVWLWVKASAAIFTAIMVGISVLAMFARLRADRRTTPGTLAVDF